MYALRVRISCRQPPSAAWRSLGVKRSTEESARRMSSKLSCRRGMIIVELLLRHRRTLGPLKYIAKACQAEGSGGTQHASLSVRRG